ncbi:MAG: hypothetical protein NTX44_06555 [Ignavibacteriales bacterium]|nr:hypothetical protein [Ignavibacteriales bacterium]
MDTSFFSFHLNFWELIIILINTCFSGIAIYLIQRVKNKVEENEPNVLTGIIEEYEAHVNHVSDPPVDQWKDEALLGACKGMVNSLMEFRKFQEGLKNLLNSQIDELNDLLKIITSKPKIKLTENEKGKISYLLESIRSSLPSKRATIFRIEEEMKVLLKKNKEFRARTGKPSK